MFALDTNTLIYYFKGMGQVRENLKRYPPTRVFIPMIVVYELTVGILKSNSPTKRLLQLERLMETCRLAPFGLKESQAAAGIRSELEQRGEPIGPLDNLIAGTAVAGGLTLVTLNTREFEKIPKLMIADWY